MEPQEKNDLQEEPRPSYDPGRAIHVEPLRTFSSDLAEAVRERGGSVVRIAIAEEEKHRREAEDTSIRSKKNIVMVIVGILLLLGALGGIAWVYSYRQQAAAPSSTPAATLPSSLVTAESAQTINIASGERVADLLSTINAVVTAPNILAGTVKNIVITQPENTRIPATQFLSTLTMHVPTSLQHALSPQYMLGVYLYNQGNLFLILKGTAHDYLQAGMLEWEPKLFGDMAPLFAVDTSGLTQAQIDNMNFSDTLVENREARAVLDANKKNLLFYSFIDPNTIVITADAKTLAEVVRRSY